jgi:hypothetical protein
MTTQDAIQAIVTYNTLPPQIDFTLPYQRKAIEAEKFLDTLSYAENDIAQAEIMKQIHDYFESGATYYDSLF